MTGSGAGSATGRGAWLHRERPCDIHASGRFAPKLSKGWDELLIRPEAATAVDDLLWWQLRGDGHEGFFTTAGDPEGIPNQRNSQQSAEDSSGTDFEVVRDSASFAARGGRLAGKWKECVTAKAKSSKNTGSGANINLSGTVKAATPAPSATCCLRVGKRRRSLRGAASTMRMTTSLGRRLKSAAAVTRWPPCG